MKGDAAPRFIIGWDVGGAHLKAALLERSGPAHGGPVVRAVRQCACPLWQGLDHLESALADLLEGWPEARSADHAVTMTGELVDAFEHREAGVKAITDTLQAALLPFDGSMKVYAGPLAEAGGVEWIAPDAVGEHWERIASANWRATAQAVAACIDEALLVDIGSTTTDLVAVRQGRVVTRSLTDLDRLRTGELVYVGVVRTPLCSLGAQVPWDGGPPVNVMNEFFATTADVYRLLGELDPEHDQYPPADGGDKSLDATRRRLARMIGLDARDGSNAAWSTLAAHWREAQLSLTRRNAERVIAAADLSECAPLIVAGAGHRLGARLAGGMDRPARRIDELWGTASDDIALAAPCVAVARLWTCGAARP